MYKYFVRWYCVCMVIQQITFNSLKNRFIANVAAAAAIVMECFSQFIYITHEHTHTHLCVSQNEKGEIEKASRHGVISSES